MGTDYSSMAVVFDGVAFKAVGEEGRTFVSHDGGTWMDAGKVSTDTIYGVAIGGGNAIAVGI
jgi:hypothetical protein